MHAWDSGQYLRVAEERARPALDGIPLRSDGKVVLPYPRLFFIATPRRWR